MSEKYYTTKTAALKATVIDARTINLKDKNILDYINENVPTVLDGRGENDKDYDLWGSTVKTEDGVITVSHKFVENPNAPKKAKGDITIPEPTKAAEAWNSNITKVVDNKAYTGDSEDSFYANIQTDMIQNGNSMFCYSNLTSFDGNLDNLTEAWNMFRNCKDLTSFNVKLPNLTNGWAMFCDSAVAESFPGSGIFSLEMPSLKWGLSMFFGCTGITTFTSDLSNLISAQRMFQGCTNLAKVDTNLDSLLFSYYAFANCEALTSFDIPLPKIVAATSMFSGCTNLTSFSSDLSALKVGNNMFSGCSSLTSFSGDLSSLVSANNMFNGCKLDIESIICISDSIRDLAAEGLVKHPENSNTWEVTDKEDDIWKCLAPTDNRGWPTNFNNDAIGNPFNIEYYKISVGAALPALAKITIEYDTEKINDFSQIKEYIDEIYAKGWNISLNGYNYIPSAN